MRLDDTLPFVLLDDARADGAPARLYRDPVRVVQADTLAEVPMALAALRHGQAEGLDAAGYVAFEAGAAFEPVLAEVVTPGAPLLWFGLFDGYETLAPDAVPSLLPGPAGALVGVAKPLIERERYDAMLAEVLALIRAGDIYQANLTFQASVSVVGDPLAAYAQLRERARAGYGAIVATGEAVLLSLSPELFFALDGGTLVTRPMKGTAPRGASAEEDQALVAALADDTKQRAENLMIVDLLRNDLSRVAVPGSVAVPSLFEVETYPTVHQMTSTVTAQLADGADAIDVLAALFPCGSITGAPKIRAMQVIATTEAEPRGAYTGAIGRIDATGDAMFNVAIRTLVMGDGEARIGLGSGIVADSQADAEWDECLAKAGFLPSSRRPDLIETMAFDPEHGLPLLERHLARMKASAVALGYPFDRHAARNELQAATFTLRAPAKVRLVLAPSGAVAIETGPMPAAPTGPVAVKIVPLPVDPRDYRLRHKTSDRSFYDDARRAAGTFEVLFTDPHGRLTEGSFTSLFVQRGDTLVTPPLGLGLLPGVLRQQMIETGAAREGELTAADLAGGFFIGNALRGLMPAQLVA
ncbi:aminodeoxychorismate synthase component I [Sphingomonas sp. GlSt437]|uniref:aminodeoxychorismate synthase component I n=1 Tax=Sphingomonas sp. GlSt437 TaxID=3389970 RepID=UPI003A89A533